jgi:hypothetical protein
LLLFLVELLVRGADRVDRERLGIANIGEVAEQL